MSKYSARVNKIYEYMKNNRGKGKAPIYCSKENISIVLKCCKTGDFSAAHETKLYTHNGGCYCELQTVILEIEE